jgi:hypothetical protein
MGKQRIVVDDEGLVEREPAWDERRRDTRADAID